MWHSCLDRSLAEDLVRRLVIPTNSAGDVTAICYVSDEVGGAGASRTEWQSPRLQPLCDGAKGLFLAVAHK